MPLGRALTDAEWAQLKAAEAAEYRCCADDDGRYISDGPDVALPEAPSQPIKPALIVMDLNRERQVDAWTEAEERRLERALFDPWQDRNEEARRLARQL